MSDLPKCCHRVVHEAGITCHSPHIFATTPDKLMPASICAVCPYADRSCDGTVEVIERVRYGLGDRIEQALTMVGITAERVTEAIGAPCGCEERKEKINKLGEWANRVWAGLWPGARAEVEDMLPPRDGD